LFRHLRALFSRFFKKQEPYWAVVGDFSCREALRKGFRPKILVYDNRTCRRPIDSKQLVKVPRGYEQSTVEFFGKFDKGLLKLLENCCLDSKKWALEVIGEEDLFVFALAYFCPIGRKIKAGCEEITVTKDFKKLASSKIKRRSVVYV
jgi:uncharacterized protein (UPF0218 family)